MLKHKMMESEGIVVAEPMSTLSADDFLSLTSSVDAYLADHATVRGLLIHAKEFPGWESFAGLTAHIRSVREHHRNIKRVALVTDSAIGTIVQSLAKHFVSAEVRLFAYPDFEKALYWLKSE
jgi:SpoIIAA-like